MEFKTFAEKVKGGVADFLDAGYQVEVIHNKKNNGVELTGIVIMRDDSNISPTIYLEDIYVRYLENKSLGEAVKSVLQVYEENKIEGELDVSFFLNYEKVKDIVVFKLINFQENQALLKEIPYVRFLDMAVVFYCNVLHEAMGNLTVPVRNNECSLWQVDSETLFKQAVKNAPRLMRPVITSFWDMIEKKPPQKQLEGAGDIFVLSNDKKFYGAACLLYPGVLETFARERQVKDGFYILPSSVHEVLLVPGNNLALAKCFREMVREVNKSQLDVEEVLSDYVYYYRKEEKDIVRL